jgi:predicted TIM-barrel fold metal-dependent hydrolase
MIRASATANHATFDLHTGRVRTVQPRTNRACARRLTNLAAVPAICSVPAAVRKYLSRTCYGAAAITTWLAASAGAQDGIGVALNDVHFHLTNYVQRGPDIHEFLKMMGDSVGRVALFGIPLQQEWRADVNGDRAPTYYLQSDAPLYYYSFTDAFIAMQYRSLTPAQQARFDPMITGFNPGDLYAADHIRRVLTTFPGVFTGIGEFSIHKEFVSDKADPGPASLLNPALDSILATAGDIGLLVLIHNDMDVPFAADTAHPAYLDDMEALIRRHPETTIIWAHTGMGRVVRPVKHHAKVLEAMLADPTYKNLYFDISWDVVAKYLVSSPEAIQATAALINRYPDRFLFGTDALAPRNAAAYLTTDNLYAPVWAALSPDARAKVRVGNYERLFDTALRKVRAWEAAHLK